MNVRFLSAGDKALVVEFGDRIDRALSAEVLRLNASLRSSGLVGVVETVPTFRSLMVHYDPLVTTRANLERGIASLLDRQPGSRSTGTLWRVPVCYDGEFAPDLAEVAHLTGLSPGEVIALHSGTRYHVYMLGFLPGFPYMGDLPAQLALPRRADPRVSVPAGSISIATTLTAIYPYESPGGWHLIGTTPIRLFDCNRTRPALFAPGDTVLFEPIDMAGFAMVKQAVDRGDYRVASEPFTASLASLPDPAWQSMSQVPRNCADARARHGHDEAR
jgi:inhibitor of KinA